MAQKRDQDETGFQPQEGPILCANNCGFFGSKATMNLCSRCYRDVAMAQESDSAVQAVLESAHLSATQKIETTIENILPVSIVVEGPDSPMAVEISVVTAPSAASSSTSFSDPVPQRPTNRCFSCNKRVGLTGFKCKCGDVFCSLHRYSDKHNCSFDYKTAGRDAIAKANPVVMARKIDKI